MQYQSNDRNYEKSHRRCTVVAKNKTLSILQKPYLSHLTPCALPEHTGKWITLKRAKQMLINAI